MNAGPQETDESSPPQTNTPDESGAYFLGRQPLLDRKGRIAAHDLLFRDSRWSTEATFDDPLQATAQVLVSTFSNLGVDAILGSLPGFINADPHLEIANFADVLPASQIIFDLPPVSKVDDEIIDRMERVRHAGFRICLDQYEYKDERVKLLPYADFAKVDTSKNDAIKLRKITRDLDAHSVLKIATRVETAKCHRTIERQGWDLAQGYYFARPETLEARRPSIRRSRLVELITTVNESTPIDEIADRLRSVPHLIVNLLSMANLLRTAPGEKIESIQQAVVMLGRERLMRWLYLLLYASDDQNGCADPLCQLATARSKTMESLAKARAATATATDTNDSEPDRAGLTGMLSLAPALLGLQTKELTRRLSLDYSIEEALMRRKGPLGKMLLLIEAREEGDLPSVVRLLDELELSPLVLQQSEVEAATWVNELSGLDTSGIRNTAHA